MDIESFIFEKFSLFIIEKVLIPEEKKAELKRYRDILLATIDYSIERSNVERYGEFNSIAHYQL